MADSCLCSLPFSNNTQPLIKNVSVLFDLTSELLVSKVKQLCFYFFRSVAQVFLLLSFRETEYIIHTRIFPHVRIIAKVS